MAVLTMFARLHADGTVEASITHGQGAPTPLPDDGFLDDDENVKAMRETAEQVGLTHLLREASHGTSTATIDELLAKALRLLGEK